MAKRPSRKTGAVRNPDRRNGKRWTSKQYDPMGRALTGRGKPSGHSVRGMKVTFTPRDLLAAVFGEHNAS